MASYWVEQSVCTESFKRVLGWVLCDGFGAGCAVCEVNPVQSCTESRSVEYAAAVLCRSEVHTPWFGKMKTMPSAVICSQRGFHSLDFRPAMYSSASIQHWNLVYYLF